MHIIQLPTDNSSEAVLYSETLVEVDENETAFISSHALPANEFLIISPNGKIIKLANVLPESKANDIEYEFSHSLLIDFHCNVNMAIMTYPEVLTNGSNLIAYNIENGKCQPDTALNIKKFIHKDDNKCIALSNDGNFLIICCHTLQYYELEFAKTMEDCYYISDEHQPEAMLYILSKETDKNYVQLYSFSS